MLHVFYCMFVFILNLGYFFMVKMHFKGVNFHLALLAIFFLVEGIIGNIWAYFSFFNCD